MAKALLRLDTSINFRTDIKTMLAGVVTTEHYNLNNHYICTTSLSNKVLKFYIYGAGYLPQLYIGDEYDSGVTITNEVTICNNVNQADECHIVLKGSLLAICSKYQTLRSVTTIIGKTQGGTEKYFAQAFGVGINQDNFQARNTSDDAVFDIGGVRQTSINTVGGKYYMSDLIATSNGRLLSTSVYNLKALYRANSVADYCTVVGDDIIINSGRSKNTNDYITHQLLIPGGNL